jgi:hypothetical protein
MLTRAILADIFLYFAPDKQKILSMLSHPQTPLQTLHRSLPLSLPQWQNQSQLQTPREIGSTMAQTQTQFTKASLVAPSSSTLLPLPQSRSHPKSSSDGGLDSSNPYVSGNNGAPEAGVTHTLNSASSAHYETQSMDHDTGTRVAWNGDPSSSVQIPQVSPSAPGFSSSDGPRAEALSKIEEFYRARTTDNGTGNDKPQPWDDRRRELASPSSITQPWNGANVRVDGDLPTNKPFLSSSASLSDEDVQVYTLGKLVPRKDQAGWSPAAEPSAVAGSSARFTPRTLAATPRYEPPHAPQIPPSNLSGSNNEQKRRRDYDEEGESDEEEERVMPTPTITLLNPLPSSSDKSSPGTLALSSSRISPVSAEGQKIRVRRSAFVPSWAVPPRVLIVDDDIISRKLGGKFLQVSGCQFDMAVDGESAVNKMMNLEKYDLVLMVRCFVL